MQITAGVIKISKTVQGDLAFILNVLSESTIHFAQFSIVVPKKVLLVSYNGFSQKRGCVTMRNYEGTCKGICSYILVCNFFDMAFSITKFSFCGTNFKCILTWERGISKR